MSNAVLPIEPTSGDVVVTRTTGGAATYCILQVPRAAQITTQTQLQAVRLARGYAQSRGVDVWYLEGEAYRLLESHRPSIANKGGQKKGRQP